VISHTAVFSAGTAEGTFAAIVSSGGLSDTALITVSKSLEKVITVSEPLGGAMFHVGEIMHIRWTATGDIAGVTISLSLDGGKLWHEIVGHAIVRGDSLWGDFPWTIVPAIVDPDAGGAVQVISDSAMIRVAQYNNESEVKGLLSSAILIRPARNTVRGDAKTPAAPGWRIRSTPGTGLSISLPAGDAFRLSIMNPSGATVARYNVIGGGEYRVGRMIPPGVYVATIETRMFRDSHTLLVRR
jgi:hypothetical protein